MTIKDIANQAGVSVSTVSKIINRKDDNISEETRKRVLQIIKDSEYVPYAGVREKLLANNNSIALVLPSLLDPFCSEFADKVRAFASNFDFTVALYSYDSFESELSLLHELSDSHVSGIIYSHSSDDCISFLESNDCNIKNVVLVDCFLSSSSFPQISRDFSKISETAVFHLTKNESKRISLALDVSSPKGIINSVVSGFKSGLASSENAFTENMISTVYKDGEISNFNHIDSGVDAIICQNSFVAGQIYMALTQKHYLIPDDVSLICLEDTNMLQVIGTGITAIKTDASEMARLAVDAISSQITTGQIMPFTSVMPFDIIYRSSTKERSKPKYKIVVVGSINMDVTLKVSRLPHSGETVLATSQSSWPGGKGANQAIGVSRFGADSYMIGRLGNDLYGKQLYDKLSKERVNMQGVSFSSEQISGTAYINVQNDGLNTIVVNPGANDSVVPDYIEKNKMYFEDAHYCLIQMEIPLPTIEAIVRVCNELGVKVILKPSPAQSLPDSILKDLFLLVPNQEEIGELVPGSSNPQQQAMFFINKGVKNVIVTLGENGCIFVNKDLVREYAAYPYPSVDSTGASDIFISCLAAQLVKERSMDDSIRLATLAASYSVSKEGVQNAIINPELLEDLYNGHFSLSIN